MTLSKLYLLPVLMLGLAGCRDEQTTIDRVADFVERCWEYVDTGDFPSRSLYWNSNNGSPRYENADSSVSVTISGLHLNHLSCTIVSHDVASHQNDKLNIFQYVASNAPMWISDRESVLLDKLTRTDLKKKSHFLRVVFQAPTIAGTFVEVSQVMERGVVRITVGKSLFDLTADLKSD